MALLGIATALAVMQQKMRPPVLWMDLQGNITVQGKPVDPKITSGASTLETAMGTVYNFTGEHGGVIFQDLDPLKMTSSMTIAAWIFLRSYAKTGPNAQIFFRGDNRGGLDPYSLRIEGDKTLTFQIQDQKNDSAHVKTQIPLGHWVHVVASFNDGNGEMAIWLNGEPASHTFTKLRPFKELEAGQNPGVAVGNVQDEHPDNEPLNGLVGDLRLYEGAWTPREVGYVPAPGG